MCREISILLVEDDIVDVKTVKRAFRQANIANPLQVASNGAEALAYLRSLSAYGGSGEDSPPRMILLNLNMPIMNGLEFLQVVKDDAQLKRIPVVVLTTSKVETDVVGGPPRPCRRPTASWDGPTMSWRSSPPSPRTTCARRSIRSAASPSS